MTKQEQIDKLNSEVKTYLAPSKIHGVGLFALRDISKGERLYADNMPYVYNLTFKETKELFPEIREILLGQWPNIVTGSLFGYPNIRLQAFINHHDTANYDAKKDVMIISIKAGEEITEDYRVIEGYSQIFPWLDTKKKRIIKS